MAKRKIFYSFHFKNDVFRVQQIRNIGSLQANKPVTANQWEEVKKSGDPAIKKWIRENQSDKSCVVVLIGSKTYSRPWVLYEIENAWEQNKGLLGIYIHNIKCPINGKCDQGLNPFDKFTVGRSGKKLSNFVKCYNPNARDAYGDISENLEDWIEDAIERRK